MIRSDAAKKIIRREMGQYFRKAREKARLSQIMAADELGISAQFLSNFENGRSSLPFQHIHKLVIVYGMCSQTLMKMYLDLTKNQLEKDFKINF